MTTFEDLVKAEVARWFDEVYLNKTEPCIFCGQRYVVRNWREHECPPPTNTLRGLRVFLDGAAK